MKAQPLKQVDGAQVMCEPHEATHVMLSTPGPFPTRVLPVILKGTRAGTGCWSWNGNTEKPTLRPSVLTRGTRPITDDEHAFIMKGGIIKPEQVVCHCWINDGQIQFLGDCTHEFANQTLDLLDVE
jgi:hypothetical protein